jgi:hypothetical protein
LKRREQKYNEKIASGIDNMKKSYRQAHFFKRLAENPKVHI